MVLCKTSHVVSYLENLKLKPSMKDVLAFTKDLTLDQAKDFMSSWPIHHAVVNPGDTLFIPAGWLVNEGVVGKGQSQSRPCAGVRLQSLAHGDLSALEELERIFNDTFGKPHSVLSQLKDKILLCD